MLFSKFTFSSVENVGDVDLPAMLGGVNVPGLLIGRVPKIRVDDRVGRVLASLTAQPTQPDRSGDRSLEPSFGQLFSIFVQYLQALRKTVNVCFSAIEF